MSEKNAPLPPAERIRQIENQRSQIIALEPEKALKAILASPQPAPLVHSFTSEDLYFLVHDIGPEDALPILALASQKQWEHLLDMEIWNREGMDQFQATRWLSLLHRADPERLARMCVESKLEFLSIYLLRNIEVRIREHDQNPSEFGPGFFSDDDTFYVRLMEIEKEALEEKGALAEEQRKTMLPELLRRISRQDHLQYQNILLELAGLLPAEKEEHLFRLRSTRLAEKGFLPFDEAIAVYQPLAAHMLKERSVSLSGTGKAQATRLPVPHLATGMLREDNPFAQSLGRMTDMAEIESLMAEFAGLCNQVIMADRSKVTRRATLARVVQKVSNYIGMGMETVLGKADHDTPQAGADLLRRYILANLFQVGFGAVLPLKWKAEKWRRESWFENARLPLHFWGEEWLGVLGGLLIKKPLFFDQHAQGDHYREFASLEERDHTLAVLKEIIAMDDLLSLMDIQIDSTADYGFTTHKSLLLTLWAAHHLGTEDAAKRLNPIRLAEFKRFFGELWTEGRKRPRTIAPPMKALFLAWLADNSGLEEHQIAERMGATLEKIFIDIENELGAIAARDLDPRFITLFHVK